MNLFHISGCHVCQTHIVEKCQRPGGIAPEKPVRVSLYSNASLSIQKVE